MIKTIATTAVGVVLGAGVMLAVPSNATDASTHSHHVKVQMKQVTVDFHGVKCATFERHKAIGGAWSSWSIPFANEGACAPIVTP